jgi:orotate phosphoribosyltransferase
MFCVNARTELAKRVFERAHLTGSFVLRSGVTSDRYFDKYRFESDPELLSKIGDALKAMIPDGIDYLAGLELGGIPIATVLGQLTKLPVVFVRKKTKEYGTRRLAEGAEIAGKRLLIVEDVVTSGGQIIESVRELRELGALVETVLSVIDRESGGPEALQSNGLELRTLFTASELEATKQKPD